MMISGNSSTSSAKAYAELQSYKSLRRLASGSMSTSSDSDSSAAVSISDTLKSLIASGDAANSNSLDAVSMLQTSSGYLSSVSNDLDMMKKLAVQAQSGTLSEDDKASVDAQFKTLQDDIATITSNYNALGAFDGSPLFQGQSYKVQTGANQGQTTTVNTPDLTDSSEADAGSVNTYSYDASNSLVGSSHTSVNWGAVINGVAGLNASDADAVGTLDAAISYASKQSASNGADISSLVSSYASNETYNSNLSAALNMFSGTDMASESVVLVKSMIMNQSQTAMQTQANSLTDLSMKLALMKF